MVAVLSPTWTLRIFIPSQRSISCSTAGMSSAHTRVARPHGIEQQHGSSKDFRSWINRMDTAVFTCLLDCAGLMQGANRRNTEDMEHDDAGAEDERHPSPSQHGQEEAAAAAAAASGGHARQGQADLVPQSPTTKGPFQEVGYKARTRGACATGFLAAVVLLLFWVLAVVMLVLGSGPRVRELDRSLVLYIEELSSPSCRARRSYELLWLLAAAELDTHTCARPFCLHPGRMKRWSILQARSGFGWGTLQSEGREHVLCWQSPTIDIIRYIPACVAVGIKLGERTKTCLGCSQLEKNTYRYQ